MQATVYAVGTGLTPGGYQADLPTTDGGLVVPNGPAVQRAERNCDADICGVPNTTPALAIM